MILLLNPDLPHSQIIDLLLKNTKILHKRISILFLYSHLRFVLSLLYFILAALINIEELLLEEGGSVFG